MQRFTVEQVRKLILETNNRLTNRPSDTDADENFSDESETEYSPILGNSTDDSSCEGNTSESYISDLEQQKIVMETALRRTE